MFIKCNARDCAIPVLSCVGLIPFNSLEGLNIFFGYIAIYYLDRNALNLSCMAPSNTHMTSFAKIRKIADSNKITI
jgi:hypothetical protein